MVKYLFEKKCKENACAFLQCRFLQVFHTDRNCKNFWSSGWQVHWRKIRQDNFLGMWGACVEEGQLHTVMYDPLNSTEQCRGREEKAIFTQIIKGGVVYLQNTFIRCKFPSQTLYTCTVYISPRWFMQKYTTFWIKGKQ